MDYFKIDGSRGNVELFQGLSRFAVSSVFNGKSHIIEAQNGSDVKGYLDHSKVEYTGSSSQEFEAALEWTALSRRCIF